MNKSSVSARTVVAKQTRSRTVSVIVRASQPSSESVVRSFRLSLDSSTELQAPDLQGSADAEMALSMSGLKLIFLHVVCRAVVPLSVPLSVQLPSSPTPAHLWLHSVTPLTCLVVLPTPVALPHTSVRTSPSCCPQSGTLPGSVTSRVSSSGTERSLRYITQMESET